MKYTGLQGTRAVAIMFVVGIIGLALGVAIGYGIYYGKATAFETTQTITYNDVPQHLSTITKLIVAVNVLHNTMVACNTTTYAVGTAYTTFSNSTQYIFPLSANSTFLNVTITTTTSLSASTTTDRTVSTTACGFIP